MKKLYKFISAFLALIFTFSTFSIVSATNALKSEYSEFATGNVNSASDFANSDVEAYAPDKCFYISEEDSHVFMMDYEDLPFELDEREYITNYATSQITYLSGYLYCLHDEAKIITKIDVSNHQTTDIVIANSPISRFAISDQYLFYLENHKLYQTDLQGNANRIFLDEHTIQRFWLENASTLTYITTDDSVCFRYNILTNEQIEEANVVSTLNLDENFSAISGTRGLSVPSLKEKFPHGKYWNHVGQYALNPDGYTSTPCTCSHAKGNHPKCDGHENGSCTCNAFDGAIQCMGYALKVAYDYYGSSPRNWSKVYNLASLKAGDYIRYKNSTHSIWVTGVNGDTVTYTDCNSIGKCQIRWEGTISKSTIINAGLTYVRSAPASSNGIPGKPALKFFSRSYAHNETTTFFWDDTENTTHYNLYVDRMNSSGEWERTYTWHYAVSGFSNVFEDGVYRVLLQSTNSNVLGWPYTDGDWVNFAVGEHFHDKETYEFFEAVHPHYKCYRCSICNEIWRNTDEPTFVDSCLECHRPSVPVLLNMQETYDPNKDIVFSWNATSNTTHYNAYFDKMGSDGTYTRIENAFYVESGFTRKLDVGKYRIVLQATNSNYFEADHSNWLFTEGNWVEFEVSHSYKSTVTTPTCTAQGYTTHTCSVCGDSYKDTYTAALGHSYTYKVTTAPAASADGKLTGTCSRCNSTTAITLPKLNTSDYTYSVVKAASCTATGTGRYVWKTTTYGKFQFDVTLPKTDHSYKSTVTAPTCTAQGYTTHTCSVCGDSYKDTYTAALGHNYTYKVATAPTASADGKLTGTCSRCNSTTAITLPKLNTTDYAYSVVKAASCTATGTGRYIWKTVTYGTLQFDVTLPKTDHSYKSTVTAPTCTAQGYTTHTCSVCGDSYKDTYTAALGHDYYAAAGNDATCTAAAWTEYNCNRCGDHYRIEGAPALGHAWNDGEITTPATEELPGVKTYTCTRCSATRTEAIPPLTHTHVYSDTVVAPTCTTGGYTTHTCVCGDSYKDTYTAALGHDYYAAAGNDATCTDAAWTEYNCSRCGDHYRVEGTPALGHNYVPARGVEATCTSPGMCEWQCTRCKDSYIVEGTPLGHDFRWVVDQEATADAPGYRHEECTRCHATRSENTLIPTLDHVCDGGETCPGRDFADMPAAGNWAHAGIDYCVSHGLMNGVGKGQFDPNGTLTRAMLVTVLYRVQGEPDVSGLENPFEDVPDGMWYTEPIIWAASKQVVNGTSAATFEPDAPITREQIAAILYRYAKEVEGKDVSASAALDGFADAASVSGYARTPLGWASALGYIKGSNENGMLLLNPQGNATRAEVATILMRYLEQ